MPVGLEDLAAQDQDQPTLVHEKQLGELASVTSDVHLCRRERPQGWECSRTHAAIAETHRDWCAEPKGFWRP